MACTVAEPHCIVFVVCELMYFRIEVSKKLTMSVLHKKIKNCCIFVNNLTN
jgi:hypothetical protein